MIQIRVIIRLQSALDSKLSTTTAASTYATIASLANYLTTANAASTYLTQTNASSIYQPISQMVNYLTVANAGYYLLKSDASTIYQKNLI